MTTGDRMNLLCGVQCVSAAWPCNCILLTVWNLNHCRRICLDWQFCDLLNVMIIYDLGIIQGKIVIIILYYIIIKKKKKNARYKYYVNIYGIMAIRRYYLSKPCRAIHSSQQISWCWLTIVYQEMRDISIR